MGILRTAAHAAVAGYAASKAYQAAQPAPQMNVPVLFLPDSCLYARHFQGVAPVVAFDLAADRSREGTYYLEAAKAGYVLREVMKTPNAKGWKRYVFEVNHAAAHNVLNTMIGR